MTDHALLAPSSAHRWGGEVPCPGSVAMEAAVPEEETDESREGTAAHFVAQMKLQVGLDVLAGETTPNGWVVDDEMVDGAKLYVDYVLTTMQGVVPKNIERRTLPGAIHDECWGTPDADDWLGNTLHIFDYKYGHRFVEVFENEQLICYAADRLADLGGLDDQLAWVHFHIIQPRSFHRDGPIRDWRVRASDLRAHTNRLRGLAHDALRPGAPTVASPAACRDCRARFRCDAAHAAGLDAAGVAGSSVPFDLTDVEAGRFLAYLRRAKAQLEAMESGLVEQVEKALKRGVFLPQWQLEETQSRERWIVPDEAVIQMGREMGKDLSAPVKCVTPPQARKLGIDASVISAYSQRPRGALKVVPLDLTHAKKVFAK